MFQEFSARDYLRVDIANNFGEDKLDWDDRISWFNENEDRLLELVPQADEPALFYAGVKAWHNAKAGNKNHYPISLDATSSGLQILACLTGDRDAAKLCNVIDIGTRADAYKVIYDCMINALGEAGKIKRDDCKRAIMTSLYGSTAVPKEVFGDGNLYYTFLDTMKAEAPAAWELNEFFLQLWNSEALSHDWVLPDNFHVKVRVIDQVCETVHFLNAPYDTFRKVNQPTETGRSIGANVTHSLDGMIVREMNRRCNYDNEQIKMLKMLILTSSESEFGTNKNHMVRNLWNHYERTGFLSARILQHLNRSNLGTVDSKVILKLIGSMPNKPFEVISVHDCFRCLPNYGNDLRRQYNQILSDIAKSELLSDIISQISGSTVKIGKLDPNLWMDILDSNYALS